MNKITLPANELLLHKVCHSAIERLVECEEVALDQCGHPFWEASGEYLDGKIRYGEDGETYYPDGVPGTSK